MSSGEREIIGTDKVVEANSNSSSNTTNKIITKQESSPGELLPATSNLSRTSSLSDSPADNDNDNDNDENVCEGDGDADHEKEENYRHHRRRREVVAPPSSNSYPPRLSANTMHHPPHFPHHYPHHQYHHLPPHHQHHSPPYHPYMPQPATMISESRSSLHPPANLHPLRLSELGMFDGDAADGGAHAAAHGEDDYSPSASTISTKASLAVAKTEQYHHPAGTDIDVEGGSQEREAQQMIVSNKKHPPTPNMVSRKNNSRIHREVGSLFGGTNNCSSSLSSQHVE